MTASGVHSRPVRCSQCVLNSHWSERTRLHPDQLAAVKMAEGGEAKKRVFHRKKDKICEVCGGMASGHNFGAICCDPCKSFFRRSALKTYRGRCDGDCVVDVDNRLYCKRCRLQKCYDVGMRTLQTDLSDSEPTTSNSNNGTVIHQDDSIATEAKPAISLEDVLDPKEMSCINAIMNVMYQDVPKEKTGFAENLSDMVIMTEQSVRVNISFAKKISYFRDLSRDDQIALIKGGIIELLFVDSIASFDLGTNTWIFPKQADTISGSPDFMEDLFSNGYRDLASFYLKELDQNKTVMALVKCVCLFSPGRPNVTHCKRLHEAQEFFAEMLQKVVDALFPGKRLFPRVIESLCDLHKIGEIYSPKIYQIGMRLDNQLLAEVYGS